MPDPSTLSASQEIREWMIAFGTVFAAIGTIAAVMVALFVVPWRERRRRPRLGLSFAPISQITASFSAAPEPDHGHMCDGAIARLRVSNSGPSAADDVEVRVEEVGMRAIGWAISADPGPVEGVQRLFALNAIADLPFAASNTYPPTSRFTLPPETDRHIDLVRLFKQDGHHHGPMVLCVAPDPHVLEDGLDSIELHVIVMARNADPERFRVWIKRFEGEWPLLAGEIWPDLSVSPASKPAKDSRVPHSR